MGLIAFLKEKFAKKDKKVDKYQEGLAKSRKNFSSKLNKRRPYSFIGGWG